VRWPVRISTGTSIILSVIFVVFLSPDRFLSNPFQFTIHLSPLTLDAVYPVAYLKHYATSRKVAGSIPDEVIGVFSWSNPSSRTMALGSTQPLTDLSTRNYPGGKGRPMLKADNLTAICEPIVYKMWEPRRLTALWASTACYKDSFSAATDSVAKQATTVN
jgi:hypothetical protein